MTLGRAELESAAQLLRLPSLYLYDWILPEWTAAMYPSMATLVAGGKNQPPTSPTAQLHGCSKAVHSEAAC